MQQQQVNQDVGHVFDPSRSVFVAANAGSGKTSLLTKRVLALLLNGVAPSKILCLTFTNGAAAEMTSRITETLGRWVMLPEAELKKELGALMGASIHSDMLLRARSLFAQVLDAPVGLRLQTIHGFCQSLLARFPLEAGVGTHLSVIDDTTRHALLKEARMQIFSQANEILPKLVQQLGEHSLLDILGEMLQQKRKLTRFIDVHHGTGFAVKAIYKAFGISEEATFESLLAKHLRRDEMHLATLKVIAAKLLQAGKKTNLDMAEALKLWVPGADEATWETYSAWLLVNGRPRSRIFTKDVLSEPQEHVLIEEQARAEQMCAELHALRDAEFTASLLCLGAELIGQYDALKRLHGLMDFDDQILAALRLLSQSDVSAWVMFKLDGGIDHVLVDEAQDTSPEQWEIVRAITSEFFAGKGRREADRSLFVVGDEKQSIFRFQGADPAGLASNRGYFLQKLEEARMAAETIALTHSYRSAPEILALVDRVFSGEARAGLSADNSAIAHQAKRDKAQGYCELWPVVAPDPEQHQSAATQLARQIAGEVEEWISHGVDAGDVMVLVRRRTAFVHQLSKALKRRGIAVAGVDRTDLTANLAVQDLLAFAQILLFPEDDLTLAALLKSPLCGVSEDALFSLCHGRKGSLWQALSEDAACADAYALLTEFRAKVDYISPFALFAELLDARGFRRAFIGRMGEEYDEVLDIFLEQTLLYESAEAPSMQGFLQWVMAGESEIKRDMEHAGGRLRIMTVHAAKGLQAKIVILADTTSIPTQQDRLCWTEDGAMLASSDGETASVAVQMARTREKNLTLEEYRRLLYVALTRAEDVLIVCGAEFKKNVQEGSWYQLVGEAFEALGSKLENGRIVIGSFPLWQAKDTFKAEVQSAAMLGPAPEEQDPPRLLTPSTITEDVTPSAPFTGDPKAVQKGTAMHRILQYAPSIADTNRRRGVALALAANHAPLLDAGEQEALVEQALAVLDAPAYAPLFGVGSLPEVPISGMVMWEGKQVRVAGQIDRLAVTGDEVWIIDYKSNTRPPQATPEPYRRQLGLYRAVLAEIYPRHRIRSWLLWTAIARLDEVV